MPGEVVAIYIASKAEELPAHSVSAYAFCLATVWMAIVTRKASELFRGHKGQRDVSLIEAEAIKAFEHESGVSLTSAEIRRNVVTSGVRLNDLVGKEFNVGKIRMRGLRLCEPCTHRVH